MTTTCKFARKKQNRFEELAEAVEEHKESAIIDPNSSITGDLNSEPTNTDSDLKESFHTFQNKANAQFSNMEFNFRHMTETLTAITVTLTDMQSRQNNTSNHQTNPDDHIDTASSTKTNNTDDDDDEDDLNSSSPTVPFNGNTGFMSSVFQVN